MTRKPNIKNNPKDPVIQPGRWSTTPAKAYAIGATVGLIPGLTWGVSREVERRSLQKAAKTARTVQLQILKNADSLPPAHKKIIMGKLALEGKPLHEYIKKATNAPLPKFKLRLLGPILLGAGLAGLAGLSERYSLFMSKNKQTASQANFKDMFSLPGKDWRRYRSKRA